MAKAQKKKCGTEKSNGKKILCALGEKDKDKLEKPEIIRYDNL